MAVLRHFRRAGREIQVQAQQGRTAAAAKLRHLPGGRSRQGGKAFRREGRQQQGVRAETVAVLRLVQAPGEEGTGGRDGGIVHGRTVVMAACWRGGGRCGRCRGSSCCNGHGARGLPSGDFPRNMEKRPHLKGRLHEKTGPCLRHGPVMLYGCAGDSTGKRAGAISIGIIEYLWAQTVFPWAIPFVFPVCGFWGRRGYGGNPFLPPAATEGGRRPCPLAHRRLTGIDSKD